MRYIVLLLMYVLFFIGFMKNVSSYVPKCLSDKEIHLIVFALYPLITYFLLKNFKYKKFILFFIFCSLAVLVEYAQLYTGIRTFCYADMKYSLIGCVMSAGLIGYFK